MMLSLTVHMYNSLEVRLSANMWNMNHMPNLSQTNKLRSYNQERFNVNAFMKNFQQYLWLQ
jgi:hypothetical protein